MTNADGVAATTAIGRRLPGPRAIKATPPARRRRLRRRLSGRRRMVDSTPVRHLRTHGVDSATRHPRGSDQGPGAGQAGVHRKARHLAGRQGCAPVGAHLRNRLDVRSGRARASSTAKAVDATATWQGPGELPADHGGQHPASPCRLADGQAVHNAARGARPHAGRDRSRHVRRRGPHRAAPARPPLRRVAGPRVVGAADSARRHGFGGRLETVAEARPREPGHRRSADADDRRQASRTPICTSAPTSCRCCSPSAARTAST